MYHLKNASIFIQTSFGLSRKTINKQKVKSNEQKLTTSKLKVTSNKQKVISNKQKLKSNKQKVTNNKQKVTSNEQKTNKHRALSKIFHIFSMRKTSGILCFAFVFLYLYCWNFCCTKLQKHKNWINGQRVHESLQKSIEVHGIFNRPQRKTISTINFWCWYCSWRIIYYVTGNILLDRSIL